MLMRGLLIRRDELFLSLDFPLEDYDLELYYE